MNDVRKRHSGSRHPSGISQGVNFITYPKRDYTVAAMFANDGKRTDRSTPTQLGLLLFEARVADITDLDLGQWAYITLLQVGRTHAPP